MANKLIGSVGLSPGSDSGFDLDTKGQIHGYTTTQYALPVGSNNQIIYADSTTASGLAYGASAKSVLSVAGDLLYASSANTLARLAKGSDNQVLTMDGSSIVWETPATSGGVETGTILMFGGTSSNVPSGYLACDGTAVSRTTYSDLFTITGTQFGTGDGSSTFNLPEMRQKFARGGNTTSGTTGGSDTHTLTTSEMPSHTHTSAGSVGSHSHTLATVNSGGGNQFPAKWGHSPSTNTGNTTPSFSGGTSSSTGGGGSHENMPAFVEVFYIIKT